MVLPLSLFVFGMASIMVGIQCSPKVLPIPGLTNNHLLNVTYLQQEFPCTYWFSCTIKNTHFSSSVADCSTDVYIPQCIADIEQSQNIASLHNQIIACDAILEVSSPLIGSVGPP